MSENIKTIVKIIEKATIISLVCRWTCRWYRRLFNVWEGELSCRWRCPPGHVRNRRGELRGEFRRKGVEPVSGTVMLECLNIFRYSYCSQVSDAGSVSHRTNLSFPGGSNRSRGLRHFYYRFVGVLHRHIQGCHVCRIIVERSNVCNIHDVLFIRY